MFQFIKPSATHLLSILLPLGVSILLFSVVVMTFDLAKKRVSSGQEQDIEDLVSFAASAVEQLWIEPRNHAIIALAQSETLHRRLQGKATFEDLAREWEEIQRSLQGCYFIYYGLEDGSIEHFPPDPLPPGYDPRTRPWYRTGISATRTPAWTQPYAEIITSEQVVSTVMPISSSNAPAGVISMDITLADLEEIISGIVLPQGGVMYLKDTGDQAFITSTTSPEDAPLADSIPARSDRTLVSCSDPLSNGWQICVLVPRSALAQ
ncbi:MAG: hypothetical protein LC645_02170, partial [Geobacteraceae bacterium]|nr:hypothetical protein [Geobacteraceae bacterium]